MAVISVEPVVAVFVTTDDDETYEYTRYGPDCWYFSIGESKEPLYNCAEIEQQYQQYLRGNKK